VAYAKAATSHRTPNPPWLNAIGLKSTFLL
jgi:hypothetical protein